jgi:hypothetical protein
MLPMKTFLVGLLPVLFLAGACSDGNGSEPSRPARADAVVALCTDLTSFQTMDGPIGADELDGIQQELRDDAQGLEESGDRATAEKVRSFVDELGRFELAPVMSVLLNPYISDGRRVELESDIKKLPQVGGARYVSKAQAFEEFKQAYADRPDFYKDLPPDALPARFEVQLTDARHLEDVQALLVVERGIQEVRVFDPLAGGGVVADPELLSLCVQGL